MNIFSVNSGNFKLDGGAMFGVVPKSIWNRTNPADENNMCNWSMRCMLVQTGNRLILIDNGIGDKQDAKFFSYYFLNGDDTLEKSVNKAGFSFDEITDVFLTHLHFDHCGGSIKYADSERTKLVPTFKNATYWSNAQHWKWATEPNPREKASFIKENILPIEQSGQLKLIEKEGEFLPGFDVKFVYGHTDAMMLPLITHKNRKILYTADLTPSVGHLPIPYVMGYDVRPLETLKEKERLLNTAAQEDWLLFFEHDSVNECCSLEQTEKGVRRKEAGKLADFI
ncbi:MAG: beta-lactamase [Bacteroidetes bacterium]|jgi:glyoxylase-like metal-dependent hydrolase (beta-lactamase superfamily II)|nr:beta-lactamase [Bacteroidota bacterium]